MSLDVKSRFGLVLALSNLDNVLVWVGALWATTLLGCPRPLIGFINAYFLKYIMAPGEEPLGPLLFSPMVTTD